MCNKAVGGNFQYTKCLDNLIVVNWEPVNKVVFMYFSKVKTLIDVGLTLFAATKKFLKRCSSLCFCCERNCYIHIGVVTEVR